jgi:GT2 family glycosyltransferase
MPKVDIIILNYNGRHFLKDCLIALRAQTFKDFQTVLVDNGSTDGSVEYVQKEFPEVRVIGLPENLGFCGGNNRGIDATSAEYIALLNNDTEVVPGWLQALVVAIERYPEVGFCASKMIRLSDRMTIDTAGDIFYTYGVGGKRGAGEPATEYMKPERVFGACAGAALYRRSMLAEIGLLDEDFFAVDEDIDLSFRAQLRGYQCLYVPDAIVYHYVSGSFGALTGHSIRRIRRNMFDVVIKNMPASLLLKYILPILGYYICGDIYFAIRGYALPIMLARWENLKRLGRTLAKRRAIQRGRKISSDQLEAILTPGGLIDLMTAARRRLSL